MDDNVIQFVPRPRNLLPSERLRQEMIRVARARYQAIFPDDFTNNANEDTAPCEYCAPVDVTDSSGNVFVDLGLPDNLA